MMDCPLQFRNSLKLPEDECMRQLLGFDNNTFLKHSAFFKTSPEIFNSFYTQSRLAVHILDVTSYRHYDELLRAVADIERFQEMYADPLFKEFSARCSSGFGENVANIKKHSKITPINYLVRTLDQWMCFLKIAHTI